MIILPGAVAGDAGAVLDLGGSEYGASKSGSAFMFSRARRPLV